VLVVGTATLATPVGETTLGNYIFAGLNTRDHVATVFGCVCAALLAVVLDQLVHVLEIASAKRNAALLWTGIIALVVMLGSGLYQPVARLISPPANPAIVGSADYTEQHILSEVLRGTLDMAGFHVDQRKGMGETIEFESLRAGSIDCYVDYTGNIWTTMMKRLEPADRETTLREVREYLHEKHGVMCLGPLGFENAYALAMRKEDAEKLRIRSLSDLKPLAPRMILAGDLQFFHRPEWQRVRSEYGLSFKEIKPVDPTLMYPSLKSGAVQVICAYTSDGRIQADNLVVLDDPKQAFPPYDAILLVSPKAIKKPGLQEALAPLLGAIDIHTMREANKRVDVEGARPKAAGRELFTLLRSRKGAA
jgi:osmoprotectant transport system permease protein